MKYENFEDEQAQFNMKLKKNYRRPSYKELINKKDATFLHIYKKIFKKKQIESNITENLKIISIK